MTLPEIPKEENEQPKITCRFCGKEGASKPHERFCSKNPNNPRTKKKMAMKQEPLLEEPILPPPSTPAEPLLVISNVQPYIGDDVAWFNIPNKEYFMEPYYIGIANNIPVVLVQHVDGALLPPSFLPGFIGMFPANKMFPETKSDDEPFPPFPEEEEEEEEKTEVKAHLLDEKISFNLECKPAEKPKKSWWPFSYKKTAKPETPKPDTNEITELVEGAINATG